MMKTASSNVKTASFEAVIVRKDGTVENLGTIAMYHKNPFARFFYHLTHNIFPKNRSK